MESHLSRRGQRHLQAMADAAPEGSRVTGRYMGKQQGLMLYGPGSKLHMPLIAAHRKAGGRVLMWDLGYWDRERGMRLSIDAMHPTPEQLSASPARGRREFTLRQDADPAGPILLVGVGDKSVFAYGLKRAQDWERKKLADLRRRYPGRQILWRPKGARPIPLERVPLRHGMPIEDALGGCSLVVCHHSNVAIDACIAGIPVECEAGAAHALYRHGSAPDAAARSDFLARLSWWEWGRSEAAAAWDWIGKQCA